MTMRSMSGSRLVAQSAAGQTPYKYEFHVLDDPQTVHRELTNPHIGTMPLGSVTRRVSVLMAKLASSSPACQP